jgi:hypothetical protein
MWSVNLIMGTISGKTHLKMIFSFSLGNGKDFIDSALCSSHNSGESNLGNGGGGGWECIPLFVANDQETPCPEKHEHDGRC